MSRRFSWGNVGLELYWSKRDNCPKVRITDDDDSPYWDYEDCAEVDVMSRDVAKFRTLNAAANYLGLNSEQS